MSGTKSQLGLVGRRGVAFACLGSLLVVANSAAALADVITTSPGLPPASGTYAAAAQSEFNFGGGTDLVATDVAFTPVAGSDSQSFNGGNEFDTYQATITGTDSFNGPGGSFSPFSLTGTITVETVGRTSNSELGTFTTSMTGLSFSVLLGGGHTLTGQLSQASPGQTTITAVGAGDYQIHSFFDVFTEISIDGGPLIHNTDPNGDPNQSPGTVDGSTYYSLTTPEPGSMLLLASGGFCALAAGRWRRRCSGRCAADSSIL